MPQIYSGDEIAMLGGEDPDNRRDFPGGFAGDAQSAFTAAGRTAAQKDMYDHVHGLLDMRARYPELQTGEEQVLHADADTLVYARGARLGTGCATDSGRMLVALNKASEAQIVTFSTAETALDSCTQKQAVLGTIKQSGEQWTIPPGASLSYWQAAR